MRHSKFNLTFRAAKNRRCPVACSPGSPLETRSVCVHGSRCGFCHANCQNDSALYNLSSRPPWSYRLPVNDVVVRIALDRRRFKFRSSNDNDIDDDIFAILESNILITLICIRHANLLSNIVNSSFKFDSLKKIRDLSCSFF